MSMHFTWKPWRHFGSTLTSSLSRNSPRQIEQSVARIWIPESYAAIGIRYSVFFFSSGANPLNLPAVCSGDSEANRLLLLYLKAHLTIKFSARAESREQNHQDDNHVSIEISPFVAAIILCTTITSRVDHVDDCNKYLSSSSHMDSILKLGKGF